jgi:hypothetical protein
VLLTAELKHTAAEVGPARRTAHVPAKIADPLSNFIESKIEVSRQYNQYIASLAHDNSFRDLTADQIAANLVSDLSSKLDPVWQLPVWRPDYVYTLTPGGSISMAFGADNYVNPLLFVEQKS